MKLARRCSWPRARLSSTITATSAAVLDFIDQLKDKIAALPGVTEKSAGETVAAMASIKDAPQPLLNALAAGVPELTASFGSATKGIENFASGWNEIQEKGGDSNAFIQKFVEGLSLVEQRSGNAESTQQTLWETVQRGLAGVAVDAQSLETITSKLDASKVKEFGDALKAALGTGGTVTPKGDQLADFRVQVNQMEAAWKGSHVDMLAEAVSMWQGETKVARESDTQIREVANSLAEAQKSYNAAVASSAEQAQRKATEAAKQAAREQQQIEKDIGDTTLQVSKIRIQSERDTLEAQVQAGQITEQQKLAALRNLANEEYKIDLQRLDDELSTLQEGTVAWQQNADRIQILMEQHKAELAKINQEIAADSRKTADQGVTAWKTAVGEITSAESSLVNNILNSQQKLSQSLLQMAGQFVEREIANDLKYYTMRALLGNSDKATEAAREQAGLLVHLTTEAAKTNATEAGNAARAASDATSHESFLEQIFEMLGQWLGFQTSKTTATVAGNAASASSDAAAAGVAKVGRHGVRRRSCHSGHGFGRGDPYVGWAMAPGVGVSVFAEASGFASAAGGIYEIPSDNFMVNAHAGEAMMPANIAGPMRDFFNNGGGSGAGGGGGGVVINQNITVNAVDGPSVVAHANKFAPVYAKAVATQLQRNPSLRGNY